MENLLKQVCSLPEIELEELLGGIGEHLRKNKIEHLINNAFIMDDQAEEIESLEDKVEKLEESTEEFGE